MKKFILFFVLFSFLFLSCSNNVDKSSDSDNVELDNVELDNAVLDNDAVDTDGLFSENDLEQNDEDVIQKDVSKMFSNLTLNPYNNAPLVAEIDFSVEKDGNILEMTIKKLNENEEDYTKTFEFSGKEKSVKIPIIGLFADFNNTVEFVVKTKDNKVEGKYSVKIQTSKLPEQTPTIDVKGAQSGDDFTFVLWTNVPKDTDAKRSFTGYLIDKFGVIRWYSSFEKPDNFPMEYIDGFLFCGNGESLIKYDFMGKEVDKWDIGKMGFFDIHHDIIKLPNDDIVLTVSKKGEKLFEDHIIEINLKTRELVKSWDLRKIFPDIMDLFYDTPKTGEQGIPFASDPIHNNSLWYNAKENYFVVSSQRSGIAAINYDGKLRWMLSPHLIAYIDDANHDGMSDSFIQNYNVKDRKTWVGDYKSDKYKDFRLPILKPSKNDYPFLFNYKHFLLKPLDKDGNLIEDQDVIKGFKNSEDFAWPFRQHAVMIMKNGNILLFDNGLSRNFAYPPISPNTFSRAVEFKVSENKSGFGGTVSQVWQYVLGDKPSWFYASLIVSDVDELQNGNILITSGAIGSSFMIQNEQLKNLYGDGPKGAFIVEVNPKNNKEVFSMFLHRIISDDFKNTPFSIYRSERLNPFKYYQFLK